MKETREIRKAARAEEKAMKKELRHAVKDAKKEIRTMKRDGKITGECKRQMMRALRAEKKSVKEAIKAAKAEGTLDALKELAGYNPDDNISDDKLEEALTTVAGEESLADIV